MHSSLMPYVSLNPASAGDGAPISRFGFTYLMPFGRPVVPDEYIIAAPSSCSSIGSAGNALIADS
jgi:hypothetical protein